MKIRLLGALVGLAISFALPTFAQQKEPVPSDKDRQVSDALAKQTDDAWNNNDAAALAAAFTEDAVLVTDTGPIYGREAIEKHYADLFQKVHFSNHVAKDDQVSPHAIGNELWCNGAWSVTYQIKGGLRVIPELPSGTSHGFPKRANAFCAYAQTSSGSCLQELPAFGAWNSSIFSQHSVFCRKLLMPTHNGKPSYLPICFPGQADCR